MERGIQTPSATMIINNTSPMTLNINNLNNEPEEFSLEDVKPSTLDEIKAMSFSQLSIFCDKKSSEKILKLVGDEDIFVKLRVLIAIGKKNEIHLVINSLDEDQKQDMYYRLGSSLEDSTLPNLYAIELLEYSASGPDVHIAAQANFHIGYEKLKQEETHETGIPFITRALEEGDTSTQIDAGMLLINLYSQTNKPDEIFEVWGFLCENIEHDSLQRLYLIFGKLIGEIYLNTGKTEKGIKILGTTLNHIQETKIDHTDIQHEIYFILAEQYSQGSSYTLIALEKAERYLVLCTQSNKYKANAYSDLLILYSNSRFPSLGGVHAFQEVFMKLLNIDDPIFNQKAYFTAYHYYKSLGQKDISLIYLDDAITGPDSDIKMGAMNILEKGIPADTIH